MAASSVGGAQIVTGAIVLAKPSNSLATLAVITGIFVLFDGLVELFASLSRLTENRGLAALLGVLNLIVGIVLIRHPIAGVTVVAMLIGIWLVAMGTVRFVLAFEGEGRRTWRFVVAAVEVIAGVVIVASPGIGFATLALLVGFSFIVNGISMVLLGMVMHAADREAARSAHRRTAAPKRAPPLGSPASRIGDLRYSGSVTVPLVGSLTSDTLDQSPNWLGRSSIEQVNAVEVDASGSADLDEHDHDAATTLAADDRAGRPRIDRQLGDLRNSAAVCAGSAGGRHLRAEELEQLPGDCVSVECLHYRSLLQPPVGPKRSALIAVGLCPPATSAAAAVSTNPLGPQT